ncbi:MAG: translation initiation factor IF-2 [Firmicutes bacterium]|jgi:translation initiation factor IF-2|nr:translation initiation factor IF-2 [Bacillota bacterium]
MGKVRVYELAKELEIKSKRLVEILQELGADVKNHMSTLEDDVADLVREHFTQERDKKQKQPKPGEPAAKKDKPVQKKTVKQEPVQKRAVQVEAAEEPKKSPKRPAKPVPKAQTQIVGEDEGAAPAKRRRPKRRDSRRQPSSRGPRPAAPQRPKEIEIPESITVKELAGRMSISAAVIIKKLMGIGVMATVPQSISWEAAATVAEDLGFKVILPEIETVDPLADVEDPPEKLQPRPPIVTIMGHVDHGKTTLLDSIRESHVTQEEAGGITQHIGAYQVNLQGRKITFLDTPGHEAFTAMRSRGAQVTDIAVLVVAADDGVMPQTREAISHAQAADVPIIVAINKMDRPDANPDRVKQALAEVGLIPEEWGGDTVCVNISALRKEGIDDLLEMILLVADLRELKANPDRMARGTIIEAKLDKGRGPVATVLISNGTLRIGDAIVAGSVSGRVRAMNDAAGRRVETAGPATPVEVVGLADVPEAGDELVALEDEKLARQIAAQKQEEKREAELRRTAPITLDGLFERIKQGEVKDFNLIIKADVQGSVEAVRQALERLSTDEVQVKVIHDGVGGITESDVLLAATSDAVIIGFNVRPDVNANRVAEREKIDIRTYRVIYDAIDDVKAAMEGLLEPDYVEEVMGRAVVRATFRVPNVGVVAGCYVTDGKVARNAELRLLRNNVVIHEGKISSLRRFKDDVREVSQGYECGIGIERFNDVKEGDEIEVFVLKEVKRTL